MEDHPSIVVDEPLEETTEDDQDIEMNNIGEAPDDAEEGEEEETRFDSKDSQG